MGLIATRSTLAPVVKLSPRTERLVQQTIDLKVEIDRLEKERKAILARLLPEAKAHGGSLDTGAGKATIVEGENSQINRDLLLAAGVKPTIIARCTKTVKYEYVRVTPKKAE